MKRGRERQRRRGRTCCDTVQGIKSPAAILPLARLSITVCFEMLPSSAT